MKKHLLLIASYLVCLCIGCSTVALPPTSKRLLHNPAISKAAGNLMIVDVCLRKDDYGDNDYFAIEESREGATALMNATIQYLEAGGIKIDSKFVPFVCGALHDPNNKPKFVAEAVGDEPSWVSQPFSVASELEHDPEYLAALQNISTFVFQSALFESTKLDADKIDSPYISLKRATLDADKIESPYISLEEARAAAALVKARSRRSNLFYIGVTGRSLSTGNAAASQMARFVTGVAISTAIGPIFTVGDTSYGAVFVPGGPTDAHQAVAGLVDLDSGTLVKTNVIHAGGDPMNQEVLTRPRAIHLLLSDLIYSDAHD